MSSILVCGGAGYIGAHMCKSLSERGIEPVVFDNLSTGRCEALRWGKFIRGDLGDPAALEGIFSTERISAVLHFAARSLVGESVHNPALYYHNNVTGTLNLLQTMLRHDVKKIIFSSTAAVYGTPQYTPIDENHPTKPINPYGHSKLTIETILADFDAAYGMKSVSLRYFNAAGASAEADIGEAHQPETHLIPNILQAVLDDQAVQIHGQDYPTHDGSCIRDYIHVDDLCQAHWLAWQYLQHGGSSCVLNLGTERGYSVLEVIAEAERIIGKPIKRSVGARRQGDPAVLVATARLAQQKLGWKPVKSELSTILASAWRWQQATQHNSIT